MFKVCFLLYGSSSSFIPLVRQKQYCCWKLTKQMNKGSDSTKGRPRSALLSTFLSLILPMILKEKKNLFSLSCCLFHFLVNQVETEISLQRVDKCWLLLLSHYVVSNSLWPHGLHAPCQASLSFTMSQSLLKFMSIESMMLSNHLIVCCLFLFFVPSIFPTIRGFSNELVHSIRWPKYWNFSISPPNEYSGLISFSIDWFDLLAIQRILKSLQYHNSKASVLWHSAFFMVQPSLSMTTGKTIALII